MELIDKSKLHDFLTKRYEALKRQSDFDFGGGMAGRLEATREAKYLKEAVERGVFDYEDEVREEAKDEVREEAKDD